MATRTVIPDIFVGDIGTHFICEIVNLINSLPEEPLDISNATEMLVVFTKPDLTEKEFDAAFVTNGTDGLMEYVTVEQLDGEKDLDIEGNWEYYGWIKYPEGQRRTSSVKFKVYPGRISELPVEEA